MSAQHDIDRQLNAFLVDGPTALPDASFDAVRDRTEQTRQRVVLGPWRVPTLNKLVPIGLGTAALVVAVLLGSRFIGSPSSNVGGPASQPPASAAPTAAAASVEPTTSPEPAPSQPASPPPLTQSFTSTVHGISISYPEGWTARAATEPWTDRPGVPQFLHPGYDVLHDPVTAETLFLHITSQPIGDSTPADWAAASLAGWGCTTTEPIAVDGATGLIGADDCHMVAVTTAGRGYSIGLYTPYSGEGEAPPVDFSYDRVWFEEVLATVKLQPEDAVDVAPSATP
jgi:hypothetical protein